jgi:hypothetical protein
MYEYRHVQDYSATRRNSQRVCDRVIPRFRVPAPYALLDHHPSSSSSSSSPGSCRVSSGGAAHVTLRRGTSKSRIASMSSASLTMLGAKSNSA